MTPHHAFAGGPDPMSRSRIAASVCLALTTVLGAVLPAEAQLSIGVAPIRVELAVRPGQTKTEILTVENRDDKPLKISVTVADWYLTKDGVPVFVKRGKSPEFSMSEWVEVNPTECEVPPRDSKILRYTVSVPAETPDGGYRTAILVETLPDIPAGPRMNSTYINARVGVIVYNRTGDVPTKAEIVGQEIAADPKDPTKTGVKLTVRNAGTGHFRLNGELRILLPDGTRQQAAPVDDAVVLPQSDREVFVSLKQALPSTGFTILSRIDVGLKEWLEAETPVARAASGK
jgi:P pilus assembly chaperone PapD